MTCGRFVAGLCGKHSQGLTLCPSKSKGWTQLVAFLGTTLHITNLKKTQKSWKFPKFFTGLVLLGSQKRKCPTFVWNTSKTRCTAVKRDRKLPAFPFLKTHQKREKDTRQHFYFSHRPSPRLRGRRLSGSWRGSVLSRFSVGFSHFWPKLTKNWPRIDPKSTPCKVFDQSVLFMRDDGLWLK